MVPEISFQLFSGVGTLYDVGIEITVFMIVECSIYGGGIKKVSPDVIYKGCGRDAFNGSHLDLLPAGSPVSVTWISPSSVPA